MPPSSAASAASRRRAAVDTAPAPRYEPTAPPVKFKSAASAHSRNPYYTLFLATKEAVQRYTAKSKTRVGLKDFESHREEQAKRVVRAANGQNVLVDVDIMTVQLESVSEIPSIVDLVDFLRADLATDVDVEVERVATLNEHIFRLRITLPEPEGVDGPAPLAVWGARLFLLGLVALVLYWLLRNTAAAAFVGAAWQALRGDAGAAAAGSGAATGVAAAAAAQPAARPNPSMAPQR